jgi:D-amino-acid dehydrogenase
MLPSRDSPLRFALRMDWRQWHWGRKFIAVCTAGQTACGTAEMLVLPNKSLLNV